MRLALVGAGGKTSALFRLGRELSASPGSAAWLSASTHLGVEQTAWADRHVVVLPGTLPQPSDAAGITLFTGPDGDDERAAGLSLEQLDHLASQADVLERPLIIEADGSRRRPLKAPAAYEPALPAWIRTVVVVAGLTGLGHPLDEQMVHRPERFAVLSGLAIGQEVTPAALANVLLHPQGGLKDIPPAARRIALLNQADTPEKQAAAGGLARHLLSAYDAVVVAALAPGSDPDASRIWAVHEPVAGVILAAGASTRFQTAANPCPKQLMTYQGRPLVRRAAELALQAGLSPVVVVVGYAGDEVAGALAGLPVTVAVNPRWAEGQSTSVIAGLDQLPSRCGSVVFLLADQPNTSPELVQALVEQHAQTCSPIVVPMIDGRRSNPVLFDRVTFDDFKTLTGDTGGRALFSRYPPQWLPWLDPNADFDVDTPEDFRRLLDRDAPLD